MWEPTLNNWPVILSIILGGTCVAAGVLRGCYETIKQVFGYSDAQFPSTGVFPAYILSGGVFSAVGGALWLVLTPLLLKVFETGGESLITIAISVHGVTGLLSIAIG